MDSRKSNKSFVPYFSFSQTLLFVSLYRSPSLMLCISVRLQRSKWIYLKDLCRNPKKFPKLLAFSGMRVIQIII